SRLAVHVAVGHAGDPGHRPDDLDDLHRPDPLGRSSERLYGPPSAERTQMTTAATIPVPLPDEEQLIPRRGFWRRALSHRTFLFSAAILLIITLIAIFAPILAPHDPYLQNIAMRLKPPFWHDKTVVEH